MAPSPTTAVPLSAATLLAGVVDYAGLFPPAALDMRQAVADYAAARVDDAAWMLGRFVVPAGRLEALAEVRPALETALQVWSVSAIVSERSDADLAAIAAFNAATARHHAVVDAIECKPQRLDGIDWLAGHAAGLSEVYVEVGTTDNPAPWLERVAARGLRAKIRTGGTTAAAFPPAAAVVAFLVEAVRAGVRVKATAGLHHAVRGTYRLTYEPDALEAPMYGYLNVLMATAALQSGLSAAVAEELLLLGDVSTLTFADDAVHWGGVTFSNALLRETRRNHLVGFGSCSIREPVDELRSLVTARR